MLGARSNQLEIVKALVKAGAGVNRKASDGYTALMFAALCGDRGVETARFLSRQRR